MGEVEDASKYSKSCLQSGIDFCVDIKNYCGSLRSLAKDIVRVLELINEALLISSYSEKLLQMKSEALFMGSLRRCGLVNNDLFHFNLGVASAAGSIQLHLIILELLYMKEFVVAVDRASTALDLLLVALELLFEECVRWCMDFLKPVSWTDEEEKQMVRLISFCSKKESKELMSRVWPSGEDSCEVMLQGLISSTMNSYDNTAFEKAFVGKILRDLLSRETMKRVLEKVFRMSLKMVNESLEDYSSPVFRGDQNETEAIQRLNLHKASTNGKHLLWLLERMIELRVVDVTVREWSEQAGFTTDLQRAFRDDA
ncbi:hypothetical protein JHK87_050584 [Glycine soja]|nr:hypothetical protein JHK87_050584 [Glycine soja]